jgi:hypothetical protein
VTTGYSSNPDGSRSYN